MPRDSILDDVEQNSRNETDAEPNSEPDDQETTDDRTQFTQRSPAGVLEDVKRVQEEYGLPSRNATINFMLNTRPGASKTADHGGPTGDGTFFVPVREIETMDRRQYLGVAGTALATTALAGCVGSGDEREDDVSLEIETDVNGLELDLEFAEDSDMREVKLIHGRALVNQASLEAGEYRASLLLIDYRRHEVRGMYQPGDYTLVVTDADGEEHEHDVMLEPSLEIADVTIPNDDYRKPLIEIENTGSGPGAVFNVGVMGDDLHRELDLEEGSGAAQLFTHPEDESEYLDDLPVPTGESVEIVPPTEMLGFVAVTGYEPNPEPHWYDDPETLGDDRLRGVDVELVENGPEYVDGGQGDERAGVGDDHSSLQLGEVVGEFVALVEEGLTLEPIRHPAGRRTPSARRNRSSHRGRV